MPRLRRRLLPPVLSAVLATAVAVPATWYLVNRYAVDAAAELAPVPSGPADRDELRAQLLAQLLEHPRLRALRGRRPPYGVVAVASAVIAGTAVAVYMDRPVEVVEATPPLTRVILEPESWVNVQADETVRRCSPAQRWSGCWRATRRRRP